MVGLTLFHSLYSQPLVRRGADAALEARRETRVTGEANPFAYFGDGFALEQESLRLRDLQFGCGHLEGLAVMLTEDSVEVVRAEVGRLGDVSKARRFAKVFAQVRHRLLDAWSLVCGNHATRRLLLGLELHTINVRTVSSLPSEMKELPVNEQD